MAPRLGGLQRRASKAIGGGLLAHARFQCAFYSQGGQVEAGAPDPQGPSSTTSPNVRLVGVHKGADAEVFHPWTRPKARVRYISPGGGIAPVPSPPPPRARGARPRSTPKKPAPVKKEEPELRESDLPAENWTDFATVEHGNLALQHLGITFSPIQLRDACACSKCIDTSTRQRDFQTSDIPSDIEVDRLETVGNNLRVHWKNDVSGYDDTHATIFSREDLYALRGKPIYPWNRGGPVRITWDRDIFARNQHWISYKDFMQDRAQFRESMRSLRRYGLVFVEDIPEDVNSVESIATAMGPLRNSFYGMTWDVRSVPDAKNVAYTSKFLGFHMDLLYMADPPGYQLLHCMRNSVPGGESLFSDTRLAVEALMRREPELYNVLCRYPMRFGYRNDSQLYEYVRPIIERPSPNRMPSLFSYVNYSPPFQQPMLRSYAQGNKTVEATMDLFVRAMRELAKELENPEHMFELKLEPGQCVIFENRRVVHARRSFDLSGIADSTNGDAKPDRWLRGAYVDEGALLSLFDRLRLENPGFWDATRFGDGIWMGEMLATANAEQKEEWAEDADNMGDSSALDVNQ